MFQVYGCWNDQNMILELFEKLINTRLDVLEVTFLEWLDTDNNSREALKLTGNNDSTENSPQYPFLFCSNMKAVRV